MEIKTKISHIDFHNFFLLIKEYIYFFLKKSGYQPVDLPVLSPALIPESYLEIFKTEFIGFNKRDNLFLTPSPELFLKRLIQNNIGDCFYLGKSFRNQEPNSSLHSFEFTMLEFYKIGVDYMALADEVLRMLRFIKNKLRKKASILKKKYPQFDFPILKLKLDRWEKIKVSQAFSEYADISENELFSKKLFIKKAKIKGYQVENASYEDLWSQIYTQEIEPHLGENLRPTLIYDYPKEFAALAKLNQDNKTAQRFEFYINGIELGDCYTELLDWKEQLKRFRIEQNKRIKLKKINHLIDKGFIQALKYGLPSCAGIAIGVERLTMALLGIESIKQLKLIYFE